MSFLELNGWAVSVDTANPELSVHEVARSDQRSYSGNVIDTCRALKKIITATTTVLSMAEADALRNLVLGRGWHFNFDGDLYSEDTGLSPGSGYSVTLGTSAPAPKFGSYRALVPSATYLRYNCGLASSYTVMGWIWDGAAWDHWARVSDGSTSSPTVTVYCNGVADTNLYTLTVTSGYAYIYGKHPSTGANADQYVDDFVVLPWAATSGQITAFAGATSAFSALPILDVSGDCLRDYGSIEMRGRLRTSRFLPAQLSTGWAGNAGRVAFELEEV